jgi:hypothetical protein
MFTHASATGRVAGIFSLAAFIPYILSTIRAETKPNRATWLIWTLVGALLAASYYASGARHTIWVPISYVVGPLVIALISLKYGVGGWTPFDRGCLLAAGASLLPWWIFNSPLVALCLNLAIDFFGALPTIRKAYHSPESEDLTAWILFLLGNTLNLAAIERWQFSLFIYPIYLFVLSGLITTLIVARRSTHQRA